jgi:hypothetical protein
MRDLRGVFGDETQKNNNNRLREFHTGGYLFVLGLSVRPRM